MSSTPQSSTSSSPVTTPRRLSPKRKKYISQLAEEYELYEKAISDLQSQLKVAEKEAAFDRGIEIVHQIDQLKVDVSQRRREMVEEKNTAERRELGISLSQRQREFEEEWVQKEEDMNGTLLQAIDELDARLRHEMSVFLDQLEIDMKAVNFKPSRELLSYRQQTQDLLRVHDFEEAKIVHSKADLLEEDERRRWEEQQVVVAKKRKRDMKKKQKLQKADAEKQAVVVQQLDARQAVRRSKLAVEKKAFYRSSPKKMGDI